jgi:hypothetical protein
MLQLILRGSAIAAVVVLGACSSSKVGDPLSPTGSPLVLGPPVTEVPDENPKTAGTTRESANSDLISAVDNMDKRAPKSTASGSFNPAPVELVVTQSGEVVRKSPTTRSSTSDRDMPPSPGRLTDAIRSGKTGLDLNVQQRTDRGTVVRDEKTRREVFLPAPLSSKDDAESSASSTSSAQDLNRASADRLAQMRRLREAGDEAASRQRAQENARRLEAERIARQSKQVVGPTRQRPEPPTDMMSAPKGRATAQDLNRASADRLAAMRREREIHINPKDRSPRDVRAELHRPKISIAHHQSDFPRCVATMKPWRPRAIHRGAVASLHQALWGLLLPSQRLLRLRP